MTKKVSVLMPLYNQAAYVGPAVESILAQDGVDLELVVVDDGSTDGSADEVERFRDARVRLFRRPHAGCVSALAFAAAQACGDFLTRQDADDRSRPGRLRLQAGFLARHAAYGLVGGDYRLVDQEGRERSVMRTLLSDEWIRQTFFVALPFCGPLVMVRREAAEAAGGFVDAALSAFEDPDLCWRVARRFPVANIPEVVYDYRRHPANVSTEGWHRREVDERWERLRRAAAGVGAMELAPPEGGSPPPPSFGSDPHEDARESRFWALRYEAGFLGLAHGIPGWGRRVMEEALRGGADAPSRRFWLGTARLSPRLAVAARRALDRLRRREGF